MVSPSYADFAPTINRLSHGLLDTATRSTVLLALVSLAVLGMRRASAATLHWMWLTGFVGLLLLPLLSAALPGWRVLPHFGPDVFARASEQGAQILFPAPASPESSQHDTSMTTHPIAFSPTAAADVRVPQSVVHSLPALQQSTVASRKQASSGGHRPALGWMFWLALVWVVGIAMVLGHLLLGYVSLGLLQYRCARINDGEWREQLDGLRRKLGVRRKVELFLSPGRTMPMTWGVWRARLLLPDEAADWTFEQRKDVLLHELGHVRRFDCATQLLVQIACAFYWFNPLVGIARNRVQVEREHACDDIVLNTGATASTYARHLLQSAAAMPALRFGIAALAMARRSTLESRLRTILDSSRNRRALSGGATWMMLGLVLIALLPVAVLQAQENPAAPPDAGAPVRFGPAATAGDPTSRPVSPGRRQPVSHFDAVGAGMAGQSIPALGEGPTCSLDATIYDVRLPADKIGRLDPDALSNAAATPADFEKALADLGTTRPLYHTDQTVRLASDSIRIGTQTPIVTGSRTDINGHVINTVTYQQTGAIFTIAGKGTAADKMDLDLQIQLSTVSDSSAAVSPNVKASLFRTATMSHKGAVDAKTPFVVLSADAASVDENGKAVVYIARITLGVPQ